MSLRKKINIVIYQFVFIEQKTIPKTTSGKIQRKKSKEQMLNDQLKIVYRTRTVDKDLNRVYTKSEIKSTLIRLEKESLITL